MLYHILYSRRKAELHFPLVPVTGISPEFHQDFTRVSSGFYQDFTRIHRNFTRISPEFRRNVALEHLKKGRRPQLKPPRGWKPKPCPPRSPRRRHFRPSEGRDLAAVVVMRPMACATRRPVRPISVLRLWISKGLTQADS